MIPTLIRTMKVTVGITVKVPYLRRLCSTGQKPPSARGEDSGMTGEHN
jgi:hypothetical protein